MSQGQAQACGEGHVQNGHEVVGQPGKEGHASMPMRPIHASATHLRKSRMAMKVRTAALRGSDMMRVSSAALLKPDICGEGQGVVQAVGVHDMVLH